MGNSSDTCGDAPHKHQKRTARPEVKTGCDNCKQRMIKCDQQWPACANCIRINKICSGYRPPPRDGIQFGEIGIAPESLEEAATKGAPEPVPASNREINNWRYALSHDGHPERSSSSHQEHYGLASRLSAAASELFRQLLGESRPQTSKSVLRALEREYGCLQLWCDGYGLASGDLDVILAESRRLRRLTVRLLVSICYTLADKLAPVSILWLEGAACDRLKDQAARTRDFAEAATLAIRDTDHAESDSDDSDGSGSETGSGSIRGLHPIEDIIEDLKTDIQCLVDLGPRFKEPVRDGTDKEEAAAAPQETSWDPAKYLTARIRHRYPKADPVFAQILGQANWDRAQRLYAAKKNTQSAHNAQRLVVEAESASRPTGTIVESAFHDSGVGTSIPTASYAETVLSYHDTNGSSIRIPPIPVEGRQGKSFECPICGCTCQLQSDRWKTWWKRHVLSDLQPYLCLVSSCSFSMVPFPHKMAWMQHLELEHGFPLEVTCPLCQERMNGGPSGKAAHLARHLEEVSLMILPANAESEEDGAGNDSDFSDVPPPLPPPRLVPVPGPVDPNKYLSDTSSESSTAETSRNTPPPNANTEIRLCPLCPNIPFTRLRDFKKHLLYHHRPYKCSRPECKYSTRGWPTAKELGRHIQDKHSLPPHETVACLYQPCPYRSKRESNWKQHMEKVHGWVYDRTSEVKLNPEPRREEEAIGTQSATKQDKKKGKENASAEPANEFYVGEQSRSPTPIRMERDKSSSRGSPSPTGSRSSHIATYSPCMRFDGAIGLPSRDSKSSRTARNPRRIGYDSGIGIPLEDLEPSDSHAADKTQATPRDQQSGNPSSAFAWLDFGTGDEPVSPPDELKPVHDGDEGISMPDEVREEE